MTLALGSYSGRDLGSRLLARGRREGPLPLDEVVDVLVDDDVAHVAVDEDGVLADRRPLALERGAPGAVSPSPVGGGVVHLWFLFHPIDGAVAAPDVTSVGPAVAAEIRARVGDEVEVDVAVDEFVFPDGSLVFRFDRHVGGRREGRSLGR